MAKEAPVRTGLAVYVLPNLMAVFGFLVASAQDMGENIC